MPTRSVAGPAPKAAPAWPCATRTTSPVYADALTKNPALAQEFRISGRHYDDFYANDTKYLDCVVEEFGLNCFGPNGDRPYLEFSFSEAGVQRSEFQSTSGFTSGAADFVDGSFYAGLGWHNEVEASAGLAGIVEVSTKATELEGFVMIGAELYSELGTTLSNSSDWGVMPGEYLNPLAPGESYTVRMYILKPSALWARELKNFSSIPTGTVVDTANSQPVRILFTVLNISPTLAARLAPLDSK
jgi:hypothetical protein